LWNPETNVGERFAVKDMMAEERTKMGDYVLRNDRHTWPKKLEALEMIYVNARFRESGNKDLVQFAYAIEMDDLFARNSQRDSVSFEAGFIVYDDFMEPVYEERRNFTVGKATDSHVWKKHFIDEFELPLPFGDYNVAIHASVEGQDKLNGWRFKYPLRDEDGDGLALSTLKPAYDIAPKASSEKRHRDYLKIVPNPTKTFGREEPVMFYYEIYNLVYDARGATRYSVNFTLKQISKKRKGLSKVLGIFGGKKYQVSIKSEHSGTSRTVSDYISFDVNRAKSGDYEMMLVVTDNVSEEKVSTSTGLVLE